MTAKISASPDGTKVLIGTATEDALQIDSVAKTVGALAPYSLQGVPAGAVMDFAMNAAPAGWLACDGAAVSRTTYAALFAAIGTTWGAGDGSTTFQLPDMRGYFRRGAGTNSDGTASGTFAAKQADLIKNHTHDLTTTQGAFAVQTTGTALGSSNIASATGNLTGGGGNAETRPKNIAVLTCIKT
jgi:microcystin-dependent protein